VEAYSVSHGKASAYLPVLELLYRYFRVEVADDKAARRARIETRIGALDPALNDTLPLLYTLMGPSMSMSMICCLALLRLKHLSFLRIYERQLKIIWSKIDAYLRHFLSLTLSPLFGEDRGSSTDGFRSSVCYVPVA